MKLVFYQTKYGKMIDGIRQAFPDIAIATIDDADKIGEALKGADILVTTNSIYTSDFARIVRDNGTALRWIHFTNSGIDRALQSGVPANVPVTNSSSARAHGVATHAMALLLALIRRLPDFNANQQRQEWPRAMHSGLTTLDKKTMLLIGLGAIGQDIARKAKAFDMRVIAISRIAGDPHVDEVRPRAQLRESLAEADVVMIATAYDPETHHMIDAAALAAMKPSAVIVNIARGPMVDQTALMDALKTGKIGGAGLDVTEIEPLPADNELWHLPNLVLTPHIAGGGGDDGPLFDILCDNLQLFLTKKPFARVLAGPNLAS